MSRGRTEPMTAETRARIPGLLKELGSPALVAQRLGVSVRRVREIAREDRREGRL